MKQVQLGSIILSSGLMLLSAFLIGCATSSSSINTYIDPDYNGANIQRLAIFPIKSTYLTPSESQQLHRDLSQAINKKKPSLVILGSAEANDILNKKVLTDKWALFLDNFVGSEIPNAGVLKEIGDTLGVDAIIQCEIVNVQQTNGVYGGNKGTTRVTLRYSIMGVRSGKLLWQASSDGLCTTGTTVEYAPPIIEAVKRAHDKILSTLPF
jgi:hypothetical protein